MGDIADQMIEDEMFNHANKCNDYSKTSKRTPAEKKIAAIRKEIALDILSGTPVGKARQNANEKYGKDWREKGLVN